MTLLLLAGTSEAKALASKLADHDVGAIASLAGATRTPDDLDLPMRTGGFGGETGFRDYLKQAGITRVLDATHPFAHRITTRTARVCAELQLPYLRLSRPAWEPLEGDRWTFIDNEEEAAIHIKPGQTAFLGTGRQTLDRFANLKRVEVICRQIDPPSGPFPFKGGRFLVGRPPFPVEDEIALFQELGVDWLVVKNAGGALSRTKLVAARALGIPVLMINRPTLSEVKTVETVDAAMDWVLAG